MNPIIGQTISHYRVLRKLGGGGMGVVYEAEDLNLERRVAIKFLPPELANDATALERFKREAQSASALNHPNIVTVYEFGHADSTCYIVMELVQGKTLRELLASGLMPVRKVIQIATQVADGLAKAHEAGILHRDLKPENLMISGDGFVKILDFGLAKTVADANEPMSYLPTMAGFATRAGVVMGTVAYMSPEQANGRLLDFRSDQFSFGLVLYEMVTGKHAHQKSTEADTLHAILREDPEPVDSRNCDAPAPLCWIVERCLAKEPEKRYVSTRDLARELAAIRDHFVQSPPKRSAPRRGSLPAQRTGFVGREKEVGAVNELLARDDVRLLTLIGPGGIGKTRLALQVAHVVADHFPGGVYFVPLAPVRDPGLTSSVIAQTLGVRETGGQEPLAALREYLQHFHTPMLLLLDNFEHLLSAAPVLAELLGLGAGLKILVTSRSALHVYGEHEFPVPPLGVPAPHSQQHVAVDALSQFSAVALFLQRATAIKPDFQLNEENADDVAEICARLDGLPLAIELAAARIKLLSPAGMRMRLASRLQLLTGGSRDLPARQQTLRGAIDWSYELLNAAEQRLFRRLSVFVGGCTLDGVEAVCNTKNDLQVDVLDGMASMVDKSLVRQIEQTGGESRFFMLDTVREYGVEKLEEAGEGIATRRAHAAYCLVLAEEGASEDEGALRAGWLDRFEIEHDNFRAALDWLTQTGNAEWGLRLASALFRFWETREYFAEGRDRLGKLLKLEVATPTSVQARALFAAGVLAGDQGDYASTEALIGKSLEIARELKEQRGVAVALNALAVFARDRSDLARSRSLLEQSLVLWRELGDPVAAARSLSNLANIVKLQGDYTRAHQLYGECRSIFESLGDWMGVAWSLNYQGDVAHDEGEIATARSLYQESLTKFRALDDPWGIASTLADLGNLACRQNDYHAAHTLYRESMNMFRTMGHKRGIARLLESFACAAAMRVEPERSLRLAGAAAALRQTLGAPLTPAEQHKLEQTLEPVRQSLTHSAGASAWLEGWVMPVEKAIEEAMTYDSPPATSGVAS